MTIAHIDRIDNLNCKERFGVISYLERLVHLSGIDSQVDFSILMEALNDAGVPAYGSTLDNTNTGGESLVLTERQPVVIDKDKVDVKLIYEHLLNEGQNMNVPPAGVLTGEVRANIQQITTNLDRTGNPVTVSHTFAVDDPDAGDYAGQTITQAGEFQVYVPQKTISLQGIKTTAYPWLIAEGLVGHINQYVWSRGAPHSWMCTAVCWKLCDSRAGANRYFFTIEFQHNGDTWNPFVVFINPKTGKPPVGLVANVGYKYVRKLPETNFDYALGAWIQGG